MTRQEANRQLVAELFNLIEQNPDLRFSQIMSVYGFVRQERAVRFEDIGVSWQNDFYTEPTDILERVQKRIKDMSEA